MSKKFITIISIIIVVFGVAGILYYHHLSQKIGENQNSYAQGTQLVKSDEGVSLPKAVPLKEPIPLLWTDDNKGENLIIQSNRHYYDGSTQSTVYFAITNRSGKDQKVTSYFDFKDKTKGVKKIYALENKQWKPLVVLKGEKDFIKKKKATPAHFYPQAEFNYFISNKQTAYFKAEIFYPKGAKGEFLIESFGNNNNAYGLLDPYFASGLVGYWSFNGQDMNGTTAYDRSGNANNGTLVNGPTPTIGKNGQALSFDGVNDYVEVPDSASLNPRQHGWTAEFWVKSTQKTSQNDYYVRTMGKIGSGNGFWMIRTQSGHGTGVDPHRDVTIIQISDGTNNAGAVGATTVTDGMWHHLAFVYDYDNSKTYIYRDGVVDGSNDWTGISMGDVNPTFELQIGQANHATEFFNGLIDEVRIYNRALSADEIAEQYRAGEARLGVNTPLTNRFTNGLVGYWSFNGQDMNGTTAYDRSGNANNGTLVNGPTPTIGKNGQALNFDGVDDYVDAGNGASLDITDAITIEAWIKTEQIINSANSNFSIIDKSDNYYLSFSSPSADGKLKFVVPDKSQAPSYDSSTSWTVADAGRVRGLAFDGTYYYVGVWSYGVRQYDTSGTFIKTIPSSGWGYIGHGVATDGTYVWTSDYSSNRKVYQYKISDGALITSWTIPMGGNPVRLSYDGTNLWITVYGINTAYKVSTSGVLLNSFTLSSCSGTTSSIAIANDENRNLFVSCDDGLRLYSPTGSLLKTYNLSIGSALSTNQNNRRTGLYHVNGAGYIQFYKSSYSNVSSITSTFNANQWYHVAGVYDGSNINVYVDGVLENSASAGSTGTLNSTLYLGKFIGSGFDNELFNGTIDEVRIYNRALSADEIAEQYRAGEARLGVNTPLTNRFTNGLVGYWSFNGQDMNGTTAYDRSGNANNGTIYGATPIIGKNGQALQFDGVDDYVDAGNDASLNITDAITIEAWVYPIARQTTNDRDDIVVKNVAYYLTITPDGYMAVYFYGLANPGYHVGTTLIPLNKWSHLTVTYDSATGKIRMYVNGVLDKEIITTGTISISSYSLFIGAESSFQRYFNGTIDEVRIYNRALSADEILNQYRAGAGRLHS